MRKGRIIFPQSIKSFYQIEAMDVFNKLGEKKEGIQREWKTLLRLNGPFGNRVPARKTDVDWVLCMDA